MTATPSYPGEPDHGARPRRSKPEPWSPIVVGCRSADSARHLLVALTYDAAVSGVTTDDRLVRVPWDGNADFLRMVFRNAVSMGWVEETTAANAIRSRLAEIERRSQA